MHRGSCRRGTLEVADYEAFRIDRKEFLGKVDDEIVAEIRKSKLMVADFATKPEKGVRGRLLRGRFCPRVGH